MLVLPLPPPLQPLVWTLDCRRASWCNMAWHGTVHHLPLHPSLLTPYSLLPPSLCLCVLPTPPFLLALLRLAPCPSYYSLSTPAFFSQPPPSLLYLSPSSPCSIQSPMGARGLRESRGLRDMQETLSVHCPLLLLLPFPTKATTTCMTCY